jgi:hypothetical protein
VSFTINISEIFGYAGQIIDAMMPVVYVVAGIGLGFVVVSKIISAFR